MILHTTCLKNRLLYTLFCSMSCINVYFVWSSRAEHVNYLGLDEKFGSVAVSLKREKLDENSAIMSSTSDGPTNFQYRVIIRSSEVSCFAFVCRDNYQHKNQALFPHKHIPKHALIINLTSCIVKSCKGHAMELPGACPPLSKCQSPILHLLSNHAT